MHICTHRAPRGRMCEREGACVCVRSHCGLARMSVQANMPTHLLEFVAGSTGVRRDTPSARSTAVNIGCWNATKIVAYSVNLDSVCTTGSYPVATTAWRAACKAYATLTFYQHCRAPTIRPSLPSRPCIAFLSALPCTHDATTPVQQIVRCSRSRHTLPSTCTTLSRKCLRMERGCMHMGARMAWHGVWHGLDMGAGATTHLEEGVEGMLCT